MSPLGLRDLFDGLSSFFSVAGQLRQAWQAGRLDRLDRTMIVRRNLGKWACCCSGLVQWTRLVDLLVKMLVGTCWGWAARPSLPKANTVLLLQYSTTQLKDVMTALWATMGQ